MKTLKDALSEDLLPSRRSDPEQDVEDLWTTRRDRGALAAMRPDHDHEDLADEPPPGWARTETRQVRRR
jgi:hypothetical protein